MSKKSSKSKKDKQKKKLKDAQELKKSHKLDAVKKSKKSKDSKNQPSKAASKTAPAPQLSLNESIQQEVLFTDGTLLADVDPSDTPGWEGKRKGAEAKLAETGVLMSELQEQLFADGRSGGSRSVLLVLQGMDSSGKGGIVRHVVGLVDPQGVQHASFGKPTPEELKHNFLWRIRRQLPRAGMIGVFDRSHYEDILVARVNSLVDPEVIEKRYTEINNFEKKLVESGTTIIKVLLHISPDEQKTRLAERLERPDKYWKYNSGDVDERLRWPQYQEAFQLMLDRTSTDYAPWHIVPANNKWFARLAVSQLVLHALEDLELGWPEANFDIELEKRRLAQS